MSAQQLASTAIDFDFKTGLSGSRQPLQRYLSAMKGMFHDASAYQAALQAGDALVYEFYDMGLPPTPTEVAYGTSITYPGKIGDEYFMTKGHFHTVLEAAEIYYCLNGSGYLLLENPEGDTEVQELRSGRAVYVPGRYAHRSVNVSATEPLVTFFAFPAHAGHDYGTIETQGFRKIIVERGGVPTVIDNPKWSR